MRWIKDEATFLLKFEAAKASTEAIERLDSKQWSCLRFDLIEVSTRKFAALLQDLTRRGGDTNYTFIVVSPNPQSYFYRQFRKYPVIEVDIHDSPEQYLSVLNEDPGDSPADAIGVNWSEIVIFVPSKRWFVRVRRDDPYEAEGILCIPLLWKDDIVESYPYLS